MRYALFILFSIFFLQAFSQTTRSFRGEYSYLARGTVSNGGAYSLKGFFTDQSSLGFTADSIAIGDYFVDINGKAYRIVFISTTKSPLTLEVDPVIAGIGPPTTGQGKISAVTSNKSLTYQASGVSSKLKAIEHTDLVKRIDTTAGAENYLIQATQPSQANRLWMDTGNDSIVKFYDSRIDNWNQQQESFMVDSVAAIRSLRGYVGQVLQTRGFSTSTDGGGALYEVVSDTINKLTVDSITQIPMVDGKYARIKPRDGVFNVRWFGAKGDGSTDDTEAFQKAFDAIAVYRDLNSVERVLELVCAGNFVIDPEKWDLTLINNSPVDATRDAKVIMRVRGDLILRSTFPIGRRIDLIGEAGADKGQFQKIPAARITVAGGYRDSVKSVLRYTGTVGAYIENFRIESFDYYGLQLGDDNNLCANFRAKNLHIFSDPSISRGDSSVALAITDIFWAWFDECYFSADQDSSFKSVVIDDRAGPSNTGLLYFDDVITSGKGWRIDGAGNIFLDHIHHECPFIGVDTIVSIGNSNRIHVNQFAVSDCSGGADFPIWYSRGGNSNFDGIGNGYDGEPILNTTSYGGNPFTIYSTGFSERKAYQGDVDFFGGSIEADWAAANRANSAVMTAGILRTNWQPISDTINGSGYQEIPFQIAPDGSKTSTRFGATTTVSRSIFSSFGVDVDSSDYILFGIWLQDHQPSANTRISTPNRAAQIGFQVDPTDTLTIEVGTGGTISYAGQSFTDVINMYGGARQAEDKQGWMHFGDYIRIKDAQDNDVVNISLAINVTEEDTFYYWQPYIVHVDRDEYPNFNRKDALRITREVTHQNKRAYNKTLGVNDKDGSVVSQAGKSIFYADKVYSENIPDLHPLQSVPIYGNVISFAQDSANVVSKSTANTTFTYGYEAPDGSNTAFLAECSGSGVDNVAWKTITWRDDHYYIAGVWFRPKDSVSNVSGDEANFKVVVFDSNFGVEELYPTKSGIDFSTNQVSLSNIQRESMGGKWRLNKSLFKYHAVTPGATKSQGIQMTFDLSPDDTFYIWKPFLIELDTAFTNHASQDEITEYAKDIQFANSNLSGDQSATWHSFPHQKFYFGQLETDTIITTNGTADLNFDNSVTGGSSTDVQEELERADSRLDSFDLYHIDYRDIQAETGMSPINVVFGNWYMIDVSSGTVELDLPVGTPNAGDTFRVTDSRNNAGTNNITIDFINAGDNIHGVIENYLINADKRTVTFTYVNAAIGWVAEL